MLTLEEIKNFCRIDEIDEDVEHELMAILKPSAEAYLEGAVTNKTLLTYTNFQYRLAVLLLINHYYNNRDIVTIGQSIEETPKTLQAILIQLQNG